MGLESVFQHPGTQSRFGLLVRLPFPGFAVSFVLLTYEEGWSAHLGAVQPTYSSLYLSLQGSTVPALPLPAEPTPPAGGHLMEVMPMTQARALSCLPPGWAPVHTST